MAQTKGKKAMLTIGVVVAGVAALWYGVFGLKPYSLSPEELAARYAYPVKQQVQLELKELTPKSFEFTYQSFDGVTVNGRISYPQDPKTIQSPVPVLIGAHAMGRSQIRWWQDSFKDRATFEQTDKITAMALAKGYAVVAIDARHHGLRKDPDLSVVDIIDNLHWWGEREPYEAMRQRSSANQPIRLFSAASTTDSATSVSTMARGGSTTRVSASASVMLCATVKAVTVPTSCFQLPTRNSRPSTNNR